MSQLGVTVVAGEPIVGPIADSGIKSPPVYLYSHFQNYLAYLLAQDLTPWVNVDDISFGVPVRSVTGPIIFSGTAVTLGTGRYVVAIDATAMGILDAEFAGFNVEVSISANPPNDPTSQSSKIVPAVLLPNGNSTFTPKYTVGATTVISVPIPADCTPAVLQQALDLLDSLTGGVTVLTTPGPQQSYVGGPYYIQFNAVGVRKLLLFNTTNGLTVATARVVAGDISTQEVQKIVLNRPLVMVPLDLTAQVLYDGTHTWTVQIYLTNPRTTATTVRRLAIHSVRLYKIASKLYQVAAGSGVINITEITTSGTTPATGPGGYKTLVREDATTVYDHELSVYAASELATTVSDPKLPAAHLLTGSSVERQESVILQTAFQAPDDPTPPTVPPIVVEVTTDNGGPEDPNNPPWPPVITLSPPTPPSTFTVYSINGDDASHVLPGPFEMQLYRGAVNTNTGTEYLTDYAGEIYSSTDGTHWVQVASDMGAVFPNLIFYGNSTIGIVSITSGGYLSTSPDGVHWTVQTTGISDDLYHGVYGGGVAVVVTSAGNALWSTNGTTWNAVVIDGVNPYYSVAYGAGVFVAVGEGGVIASSPDGQVWTPRASGTTNRLFDIAYDASKGFVAVGDADLLAISTNGTSWTLGTTSTGYYLNSIAAGGGHYVIGYGDYAVFHSTDLITWDSVVTENYVYDVTFFKNAIFLALGGSPPT